VFAILLKAVLEEQGLDRQLVLDQLLEITQDKIEKSDSFPALSLRNV